MPLGLIIRRVGVFCSCVCVCVHVVLYYMCLIAEYVYTTAISSILVPKGISHTG